MVGVYESLLDDEIRLLTIVPLKSGEENSKPLELLISPHTLLDQVSQPVQASEDDNLTWPELHWTCNTRLLFEDDKPDSIVQDALDRAFNQDRNLSNYHDGTWKYDSDAYCALSYVWGPQEPSHEISLNGASFSVGPNLHAALLQLRRSKRVEEGMRLWVDAICINQSDMSEREHQVARMRHIYTSARKVIMWLGIGANDNELTMHAVRWMAARAQLDDPLQDFYQTSKKIDLRPLIVKWERDTSRLRKEVHLAIFELLTLPYWRRMWILQEVVMAHPDAPVYLGSVCVSWQEVANAARLISIDESRLGRDIFLGGRPRLQRGWSFEFARDRVLGERQWASDRTWKLLLNMMELQQEQSRSDSDVLRPLRLAREADITDEKDRVYGVLGIRAIADRISVKPNYSLTMQQIYQDFSTQLLLSGNLDLLRLSSRHTGTATTIWQPLPQTAKLKYNALINAAGSAQYAHRRRRPLRDFLPLSATCPHELPSWVVCWSCKPAPTMFLPGEYQAGRTLSVQPAFAADSTMRVRGFIFDKVLSLGHFHPAESQSVSDHSAEGPSPAELDKASRRPSSLERVDEAQHSAYGDYDATREALWRTLVADTTSSGSKAPAEYDCLLDPKVWNRVAGIYTNGFGLEAVMEQDKDVRLCGYSLHELIYSSLNTFWWQTQWLQTRKLYNPTETQREALSWAMNVKAWRRLMGTKDGRMGLAPAAALVEDSIAILIGCSVPMVVRPTGNGDWTLIGECYVHGAMYGEVLDLCHEVVDIDLI